MVSAGEPLIASYSHFTMVVPWSYHGLLGSKKYHNNPNWFNSSEFILFNNYKMRHCITTYSRRLGRPKTSAILNRSTQQHFTSNSRQSFVLTEFTPASVNNYCLDSSRLNWLHCLTRPKTVISIATCHQHTHMLMSYDAQWSVTSSHTIILLTY